MDDQDSLDTLEKVSNVLAQLSSDYDPVGGSELHGFVTGLLVSPEVISPAEWLPVAFGVAGDQNPLTRPSPGTEHAVSCLVSYYNEIALELHEGRYSPIFDVDEIADDVFWELWLMGFAVALQICPRNWKHLSSDPSEEVRMAVGGLQLLMQIDQGTSALPQPDIDNLRRDAPDLITEWVSVLHSRRLTRAPLPARNEPLVLGPKIGRNDPCPCGSGKKYKKCCGRDT